MKSCVFFISLHVIILCIPLDWYGLNTSIVVHVGVSLGVRLAQFSLSEVILV